MMIKTSNLAPKDNTPEILDIICSIAQFNFDHKNFKKDYLQASNPVLQGLAMLAEEIDFLKEENQKLKEKNATLERYNYTVAHDLKSPMMSSIGIIDLLKNEVDTELTEEQRELVDLLEETNLRGMTMVGEILEYTKASSSALDVYEVNLDALKAEVDKTYLLNNKVAINWPTKLPVIKHNETALKQVFNNLIGNAIKHNDKAICLINIEHREDDRFHYFSVIDNGPGIYGDDADKIFDLFKSSSGNNCNDGIGLAIVKQIVDRSKGRIWVDPTFKNGAKFTFSIPK